MNVTQSDIAHLDDDTLKLLVVGIRDAFPPETGPVPDLMRTFSFALIRAIRERRTWFLLAEVDAMNDDRPGKLLEPGDDPIGDAIRELRGGCT